MADRDQRVIAASGAAPDPEVTPPGAWLAPGADTQGDGGRLADDGVHSSAAVVGGRLLLIVLFDDRAAQGLVRLCVKRARAGIEATLKDIDDKARSAQLAPVLAEITPEDVEDMVLAAQAPR